MFKIFPRNCRMPLFLPTSKLTSTWKVNIRNGRIFFTKFLFPIQLFFHRLSWLRHYLELLTLCVNIAYNVTLNMQICTAQHLISHLSVTVPSVGSPAARVRCRGKCPTETRQEEEGSLTTTAKETMKEKGAEERSKHSPHCVKSTFESTFNWIGK